MFQNLISQVLGQAAQNVRTNDPLVDRIVHFFARMQSQAFGPWTAIARSGMTCAVRYRPAGGQIMSCSEPAISGCCVCGQPTCLEHALVAATGEVICRGCVDEARRAAGKSGPYAGASSSYGGSGPNGQGVHSPAQEYDRLRKKYLRVLGLRANASEDQIRAAYRKKAVKHHPDKFPAGKFSDNRRQSEERKFKQLGEAKDWLLADLKRQAA